MLSKNDLDIFFLSFLIMIVLTYKTFFFLQGPAAKPLSDEIHSLTTQVD